MTVKVKFSDFQQITRSRTLERAFVDHHEMLLSVDALLTDLFPVAKGIRLLGVTLSSLRGGHDLSPEGQLNLF